MTDLMPQHVAMIMDGNRRWARAQGKPTLFGHTQGGKNIKHIAEAALDYGIRYITLYALSTENLKNRSKAELKHLFSLMRKLPDQLKDLKKEQVRVRIIGDISALPEKTRTALETVVEETKGHKQLTITFAINYGGRDEITRAVQDLLQNKTERITEDTITNHLDTADIPDPELIIRTGGAHRLSNFLIWQGSYSELYFTDTFWPAFDKKELQKALDWYHEQQRNFGA